MATENLPLLFGLIGVVVIVASLLSGFIERSNFPQVAVFLGLGAVVGPYGLGLIHIGLDSPILRTVSTLSLSLVLFTDALTIDLKEVKKHAGLATLILGPGTLLAAGAIAVAGNLVLGLPWGAAAMLAAPLASTDPVMLRGLLKRNDVPGSARQALRLESGLNDVVLLPIVLIAMAFMVATPGGQPVGTGSLLLQMLVIGPGAGAIVAWVGIQALEAIRKRVGVRRDYESLYSLGIALAAFAAAESMHGSGFLAVFTAGLVISSLDIELCDCFREYGETTAEIMLLFTFVLLGSSLMWIGIGVVTLPIALFVVLALLARPVALLIALWKTKTPTKAKQLIIWFGPRGLSTLLLILVPVFANTPGSAPLFHVATVVVLVSVALHGGSIMFFGNHMRRQNKAKAMDSPEVKPAAESTVPQSSEPVPEKMTPEQVRALGASVTLVDSRRDGGYLESPLRLKGAFRVSPLHARRDAERQGLSKDALLAIFCACPNDETSLRVAEELKGAGWRRAFAVEGGWDALLASGFETEHNPESVGDL